MNHDVTDLTSEPVAHFRCVAAVVQHPVHPELVLLIRSKHYAPPCNVALPGGKLAPEEQAHDAVVREVREETGLVVATGALLGCDEGIAPSGARYTTEVYAATYVGTQAQPVPTPGDDAVAAYWGQPEEILAGPYPQDYAFALQARTRVQ